MTEFQPGQIVLAVVDPELSQAALVLIGEMRAVTSLLPGGQVFENVTVVIEMLQP